MNKIKLSIATITLSLPLAASTAMAADLPEEIAPPPAPTAPVEAQDYDWSGAYLGANLGLGFRGDFDNDANLDLDTGFGFIGGGVAGYNHQINKFVVGVETDVNYTTLGADAGTLEADLNLLGSATARIGYTPVDRVLTYFEGGYAFGLSDVTTPTGSDDNFHNGYVVGAGAEYAITDNILSGVEYNYTDLADASVQTGATTTNTDFSGHSVKFNMKYKF